VLIQFAEVPPLMTQSAELDLYPKFHPELAELIEGAIGADSTFHETFGYHADGVGPETARLPTDWEDRAFRLEIADIVAICPEIHDLTVSKLLAGRDKDLSWIQAGIEGGLIQADRAAGLLSRSPAVPEEVELAQARLFRLARDTQR
jgi:hypothetical protein